MPGVGFLLGGVLTAVGSPRTAYAVAGAGMLVLVVVASRRLAGFVLGIPRAAGVRSRTPPVIASYTGSASAHSRSERARERVLP